MHTLASRLIVFCSVLHVSLARSYLLRLPVKYNFRYIYFMFVAQIVVSLYFYAKSAKEPEFLCLFSALFFRFTIIPCIERPAHAENCGA